MHSPVQLITLECTYHYSPFCPVADARNEFDAVDDRASTCSVLPVYYYHHSLSWWFGGSSRSREGPLIRKENRNWIQPTVINCFSQLDGRKIKGNSFIPFHRYIQLRGSWTAFQPTSNTCECSAAKDERRRRKQAKGGASTDGRTDGWTDQQCNAEGDTLSSFVMCYTWPVYPCTQNTGVNAGLDNNKPKMMIKKKEVEKKNYSLDLLFWSIRNRLVVCCC